MKSLMPFTDDGANIVFYIVLFLFLGTTVPVTIWNVKHWNVKELCVAKSVAGTTIEKTCRDSVVVP